MSDFEYLSVLLAIIVGIGIAHLLMCLGQILGEEGRLKTDFVHLIWTGNILLALIAFWWWGVNLRELEVWSFLPFLFVLASASLWVLMAAILYPVAIPPQFDFKAHFHKKRRLFFSILVLLVFVDPLTALVLGTDHIMDLGWSYLHWLVAGLVGGIIAIRSDNERFHKMFAVYWGLSLVFFFLYTQSSLAP